MRYLSLFLFLNLMIGNISFGHEITVVKGQLSNIKIENISLQCDENPFTGAREEFRAVILDSGKFEIFVKTYTSGKYDLIVNNNSFAQLFLCPGENLNLTLDFNELEIIGSTSEFLKWNQSLYMILNQYNYESFKNGNLENTISQINQLFKQKKLNESNIDKIATDYGLNSCEYEYCKYRNEYSLYTFIWSNLLLNEYPIESDVFNFFKELPLDDIEAAKTSLDYNRALSVYIFLKLRLENGWYEHNSFDASSDTFSILFYEKILSEIQNTEVRNITLTRKLISLLSSGSSSAEILSKRYFTDCTSSEYKEIVYEFYTDYLKKRNSSQEALEIKRLSGKLSDELINYKGQVVYLDFWASWCHPCRASIPFTKELQNKYHNKLFQVVYVNINDNFSAFESTAKELGLKNNLIYLNKEQSDEISKQLNIDGIPYYVLLNEEGTIIDANAPRPDSYEIEATLDKLWAQ